MKINIFQPKLKNRLDSFWYEGLIAESKNFYLYAAGEIRVHFPNEDFDRKNYNAVQEALDKNYSDKDLFKLEWINNNCFKATSKNGEYNWGDISYSYPEAIKMLKDYQSMRNCLQSPENNQGGK